MLPSGASGEKKKKKGIMLMVFFICSGISAAGSVLQTSSCLFVVRRCYHSASVTLNNRLKKCILQWFPTRGISLSINVVFKAILGKTVSNKVTY